MSTTSFISLILAAVKIVCRGKLEPKQARPELGMLSHTYPLLPNALVGSLAEVSFNILRTQHINVQRRFIKVLGEKAKCGLSSDETCGTWFSEALNAFPTPWRP